jgi:hypothetical protein
MRTLFHRTLLQTLFHKLRFGDFVQIGAVVVAVFTVVVSVVYLRTYIEENTKAFHSQAHFNGVSLGQRPIEMMIENEKFAHVVNVCNATPSAVSADDWDRCLNYNLMIFNAFEYWYYERQDGSIPEYLWLGADTYWKFLIKKNLGLGRLWSEYQSFFGEPFRSYVSQQFANRPAGVK